MPTRYQLHVEKWKNGCGADICARACRVVTCRGQLPCDVLFIGEAPGESEDVLGKPFVGPAGRLLDDIIAKGVAGFPGLRLAFTNLVGCIPREEDGGKATEPSGDDVQACSSRLQEMVDIASPSIIVCVGSLSRDWMKQGFKSTAARIPKGCAMIDITHPAAILRANISQRGLMAQRCSVAIADAVEDMNDRANAATEEG